MILPSSSGGGSFEVTPAGTHTAICIGIVDQGTQPNAFDPESPPKRQVRFTFELADEKMADNRPFTQSAWLTLSSHEKSTMARYIKQWTGKDASGFNIKDLLGKAATVTISNYTGQNGANRAKITNVAAPMKGVKVGTAENPIIYFSLDPKEFDEEVFYALNEKERAKITDTPEYRRLSSAPAAPAKVSDAGYAGADSNAPF